MIRRLFGWIFFISSSSFVGNALPAVAAASRREEARAPLIELFFFGMQASYQPCVDKKSSEP